MPTIVYFKGKTNQQINYATMIRKDNMQYELAGNINFK